MFLFWISTVLAGGASGWIGAMLHEAYMQRRATEVVGAYDKEWDEGSHSTRRG